MRNQARIFRHSLLLCTLLVCSTGVHAQSLPGSNNMSLGDSFQFDNHYVGSNPCFSSCVGSYGHQSDPVWSVQTRNAWGTLTNNIGGIIRWDHNGDGIETPVDMTRYSTMADVVDFVTLPAGRIVLAINLVVKDRVTGERQSVRVTSTTIEVTDFGYF